MKNTIFLSLFFIAFGSQCLSQNYQWAKSAGGTSSDVGNSCSTDGNGNVFVTGSFSSSSITFGATALTNTSVDTSDIFIVKYDTSGNVLWAKSAGGTDNDGGNSCSTDGNGNVFVTGSFRSSSITFGTTTLTNTSVSTADIFIVKYDPNGNVLWAKSAGGNIYDYSISCSTDGSGNVFITGYFWGSSITFGTITLTNAGSFTYDIFIVKYDSNGNVLWAKSAGGTDNEWGNSCSTDGSGNVFVTGSFNGSSITFGTTTLTNTNASTADIFIVGYDTSGNVLLAKSAGGTSSDVGNSCSTDGNRIIYVTGVFQSSSIIFGTTSLTNVASDDIFLVKIGSLPPAPYICLVTVDSISSNNVIVWDKTLLLIGDSVLVYRDTANNGYGNIGSVPYDSLSLFVDTVRTSYAANGNPNISSWRYKIAVKDMYGNVSPMSQYHQSIFMYYNAGTFIWTEYKIEGQSLPVPALQNYLLQRDDYSTGNYSTIATLSASSTIGTDPQFATYQNTATWRVRTAWNISCTPLLEKILTGTINTTRSNIFKQVIVGMNENSPENGVRVFPNPNNGKFEITITPTKYEFVRIYEVRIIDILGQVVFSSHYSLPTTHYSLSLPSGVYIVKVVTESRQEYGKIIIQ